MGGGHEFEVVFTKFAPDNKEDAYEFFKLKFSHRVPVAPIKTVWSFLRDRPVLAECELQRNTKGAEKPRRLTVAVSVPHGYGQGVRLIFLQGTKPVDATVQCQASDARQTRYTLQLATGSTVVVDLNVFNHCVQRFESVDAYLSAVQSYCEYALRTWAHFRDAITGRELRINGQVLRIGTRGRDGVQRTG